MEKEIYEFKSDDAFRFAREQGEKVHQSGNELIFRYCPFCHGGESRDINTFAINLNTGQFNCKRASCSATGNMITLSRYFDFSLGKEADEYYMPKRKFKRLIWKDHEVVPKEPAVRYLEGRCIPEDVTKRYEITTQDGKDNILCFPCFDEKGVMVNIKYRKTDFDPKKDKSKEWCEKDCKPILFGMKQCTDFGRLVITEGQIDSLSVATAGIDNAVSVITGKNGFTWIPYCWDWITKFQSIVVFGDCEDGHITLMDELQKRFRNKVRHVREEDYRGCKDANELLQKYGTDAVRLAVEQAVALPIKQVVAMEDVEDVDIYGMEKLKTGFKSLDDDLFGGLPFGSVCLIGGKRGEGKSTLASQLMAQAIEQGYVTFAYSGEMPNGVYRSWFEFQIAGPDNIVEEQNSFGNMRRFITDGKTQVIRKWYSGKAFIYDFQIAGDDEKQSILDTVEQTIEQYGVRVILIDNLMTAMYDDPPNGDNKYEQQSIFVHQLTKIALEYDCLILLVAHTRKNGSGDTNDDISGSGDITNLASITLNYGRDDKKLQPDQRRLVLAKNRLFGKTDFEGIIMEFDETSKRIYETGSDPNWQYGWEIPHDDFDPVFDLDVPFD